MLAEKERPHTLKSLLRGEFENVERIFHNAHDSIFAVDEHSRILFVNETAVRVFGYGDTSELVGQSLELLMGDRHGAEHQKHIQRHIGGNPSHVIRNLRRLRARKKDGSFFPVDIHVSDHCFDGRRCFIGIVRDASALEARDQEFRKAVFYDALTGLPNLEFMKNHYLDHLYKGEVSMPHVVAVIGISRLFEINATFGIQSGNALLKAVAMRLKVALNWADFFGRASDTDRFHVMAAIPEEETADQVAKRIEESVLDALDQPVNFMGNRYSVTVIMGAAEIPRLASDPASAMQVARLAHGIAKREARRSVYLLDESVRDQERDTALMVNDIRDAIANGEFYPVFQPKIDMSTGKCLAAECLVRWRKRDGTEISPGRFIPVAERADLVEGIGRFMLLEACALLGYWKGIDDLKDIKLAVNVSQRQLERPSFADFVVDSLARSGAPPERLELEITETSLAKDPERMLPVIEALTGTGVSVALDDFGTGQSSLSLLSSMRVHRGKIDRSFLAGIPNDPRATHLLRNIFSILRDMDLMITVEGVETEDCLRHVNELGCQEVQGFFYSKPLPLDAFLEYVRTR